MDSVSFVGTRPRLLTAARLGAWFVIGLAGMALVGWSFDLPVLTRFGPGFSPMSVATALCFGISGGALFALTLPADRLPAARPLARAGAVAVLAVASYALAGFVQRWPDAGLFLAPELGRVAPATAINFMLFSGALLSDRWVRGHICAALAGLGLIVSGLDLVRYVLDIGALYRVSSFSAMALPTALAFIALFFGMLAAHPDRSWPRYFVRRDVGGNAGRILAPAVVAIPVAFSFLTVQAIDHGLIAPHFGFAIMAVAASVVFAAIVAVVAALLSRSDAERARTHDALQHEVAEHRHTDAQLRANEELLRLFVESAPAAIAMFDRDMRYLVASRRFRADYGLGDQPLIGRSHYEVFPEMPERWREIHRRCLAGAKEHCEEDPFPRADGGMDWVRWEIEPWHDDSGAIGGIVLMSEVITERKRTESALAESEKKLVQAQKMEAIGNLTGGLAHDFNNLLGVIIGNLDSARPRLVADAEASELVGEALDAAMRGAELTRHLLAFARRQPLQPERVSVNNLVSEMVRLLGRMLGENIEVVLKLGSGIWPVIVDPAQLQSSLANLGANARDAMPRGGLLSIATENRQLDQDYIAGHGYAITPGDFVMIEVSDNGTGMPPEVMSRIFEPFYSTKDRDKGTGLGLSMVYGFMKQSGGHINAYSEVGKGTTFRLYLPRAGGTDAAVAERASGMPATGGDETVLVVEDNPAMRRIVLRQLTSLGYRVLEASCAADALSILAKERVDALFTDIVMPGETNGLELARTALGRMPSLKVLLTSGFPDINIESDENRLAGVRLLSKPYRREDLARMLRDALDA